MPVRRRRAIAIAGGPPSGASDPAQRFGDHRRRLTAHAFAMRDQEPLGLPVEHLLTGGARGIAREKTQSPLARGTAVRPDKLIEPHQHPFPPDGSRIGKALDQVAKDRRARRAMQEHHFFHRKRSAKHDLVDVRRPLRVRAVAKLAIEAKRSPLPCKPRGRIQPRIGPAGMPGRQREVMQLVRRHDAGHRPDGLHRLSQVFRQPDRRPYPRVA
ncbi:hypothetical protein Dimus_034997 [Dionaea muscipula]